jgi:hypothetical protein
MSLAEVLAASIACWLATIVVTAYGMDAVGLPISPLAVLTLSSILAAVVVRSARRFGTPVRHDRSAPSFGAWLSVVVAVAALILRLAWPALLPPGKGPDLTHHLLLIDFIERNWHLVHDPALEGAMGEMAHYTPGAHVLAVLFGAWTRSDGLSVVYPLMSACAALTVGFVFLIARRSATTPIALISAAFVLFVPAYFIDAFAHDSYVAQVVSALFAVALWWAAIVWDDEPSPAMAWVIAILALGTFLAWPVWIGPPLLAFYLAALLKRDMTLAARARHVAIVTVPLLIVATIHAIGQLGWALIVRTSGAVLKPTFENVGILAILAAAGLAISIKDRRLRVTHLLTLAIVLQAIVLYLMARSVGAQTPYMAFKMGYIAIYPLAAFGALLVQRFSGSAVQWFIVAVLAVVAIRPLMSAPRPVPVVTRDFYEAGRWVRENVGSRCVDYLVDDAYTAYWLHLAVLGNPRASQRTAEVDEHNLRAETAKWIPADGQRYAIADLTLLPDEIRSRVDLIKQFGRAGVIQRRGAWRCP